MMRAMTFRIMIFPLASVAVSCVTVDPIDFHPRMRDASILDTHPVEVDATQNDGDEADVRDAAAPTCRECVEAPNVPGPGCNDQVAACKASPKCAQLYECLYTAGCWVFDVRKDFILCGLPCAIEAGVIAETDPEAVLAIGVVECAAPKCGAYCRATGSGD